MLETYSFHHLFQNFSDKYWTPELFKWMPLVNLSGGDSGMKDLIIISDWVFGASCLWGVVNIVHNRHVFLKERS